MPELLNTDRVFSGSIVKADFFDIPAGNDIEPVDISSLRRGDPLGAVQDSAPTGIRYVLEMFRDGQSLRAIPLPYQPSQKGTTKRPPKVVRYTLGEFPIREHSTTRSWRQSFSGMVGVQMRPYVSAVGRAGQMTGLRTLLEFDSFLDWFQALAETEGANYLANPSQSNKSFQQRTFLVFHDLDEGQSYRVEVDEFTWDRDTATSRVGNANWRLSLHGYALDRTVSSTPHGMGRKGKPPAFDVLHRAIDVYARGILPSAVKALSPTILRGLEASASNASSIRKLFTYSGSDVAPAQVLTTLQRLRKPFMDFQGAVSRLNNAIQSTGSVLQAPFTLYSDVVRSGEKVLGLFAEARNQGLLLTSSFNQATRRLFGVYAQTAFMVKNARTVFGFLRGPIRMLDHQVDSPLSDLGAWVAPIGSGNMQPLGLDRHPASGAVSTYIVQSGDTWPSIARALLQSPDAWVFLAAFNGAGDIYSGAGGAPLSAGTPVLIPGGIGNGITSAVLPGDLYGVDLKIDFSTGDLVLADSEYLLHTGGGFSLEHAGDRPELAVSSGESNFVQALTNRVLTVRGEVPFLKSYGVFSMAPGDALTPSALAYNVTTLRDQFLQDPRTLSVRRLSVEETGDHVDVSVAVQGVAGGTVAVTAPLLG